MREESEETSKAEEELLGRLSARRQRFEVEEERLDRYSVQSRERFLAEEERLNHYSADR